MKKIMTLSISILLFTILTSTTVAAGSIEYKNGKYFYNKYIAADCGMTGKEFASKHSWQEWVQIMDDGNFKNELKKYVL